MTTGLRDFQTRVGQIENDIRFVERLAEGDVCVVGADLSPKPLNPQDCASLLKTLKANGFVPPYNLVESTIKNVIEAVFDEFRAKGVSFDDSREEVPPIVLSNLESHIPNWVLIALTPPVQKVLTETFRKDKAFAGKVDPQKIREVTRAKGFQAPSAMSGNLLTVKSLWNDLAPTGKSFADVGDDFGVERLDEIRVVVLDHLREVLTNISTHLQN